MLWHRGGPGFHIPVLILGKNKFYKLYLVSWVLGWSVWHCKGQTDTKLLHLICFSETEQFICSSSHSIPTWACPWQSQLSQLALNHLLTSRGILSFFLPIQMLPSLKLAHFFQLFHASSLSMPFLCAENLWSILIYTLNLVLCEAPFVHLHYELLLLFLTISHMWILIFHFMYFIVIISQKI